LYLAGSSKTKGQDQGKRKKEKGKRKKTVPAALPPGKALALFLATYLSLLSMLHGKLGLRF
jgi:hypothetical protein